MQVIKGFIHKTMKGITHVFPNPFLISFCVTKYVRKLSNHLFIIQCSLLKPYDLNKKLLNFISSPPTITKFAGKKAIVNQVEM